jgi:hypothetical protein
LAIFRKNNDYHVTIFNAKSFSIDLTAHRKSRKIRVAKIVILDEQMAKTEYNDLFGENCTEVWREQ